MKLQTLLKCILLGMLALFVGCSKDKINEPTKLEKIKAVYDFDRLYKKSFGDGDDSLMLALQPVVNSGDTGYVVDVEGDLSAFNMETGKTLWEVELDERVSAGLGFDSQHLYYGTFQGELVCLDRQNGSERWRKTLTSESISAPVSNGSLVTVQTIDGKVFAFNVNQGLKRWRYDSVGPILSLRGTSSPLLTNNRTYATFSNGEMVAIDNQNGLPLWKVDVAVAEGRTELERLVDSDGVPVLESGNLYAVAYQGKLVSIDVYSGQIGRASCRERVYAPV